MRWLELCDNIAFSYMARDKRMLVKSIYLVGDQVTNYRTYYPKKIKYYESRWKDMCFELSENLEIRDKKGIKEATVNIVDAIKKFREEVSNHPKYKKRRTKGENK